MHPSTERAVRNRLRDQRGAISRPQLRALGVTSQQLQTRLRRGEWVAAGRRVVRASVFPVTPEQRLWLAVLAAGPDAVVSHRSAAWLWRLVPAPDRHALTLPRHRGHRSPTVDCHHVGDFPEAVAIRQGFFCTNPLRTLVDLAGVCPRGELDGVLDRALATSLVSVPALEAELQRLARRGRPGIGVLRVALGERGYLGAPAPSVLESRILRPFASAGLRPIGIEVREGPDARYRVDTKLSPGVVVEVDGHAYHAGPEQKADDERRRNQLRLGGLTVLVYTWRDVRDEPHRVVREVRQAVACDPLGAFRSAG